MVLIIFQSIPPELVDEYNKHLAGPFTARIIGHSESSGGSIGKKKYPPWIEPPHIPTPAQLDARDTFDECQNELEAAPYPEKHCYWLLAPAQGMTYGNLYTHRNRSPIHHGTPAAEIRRPDATYFNPWYGSGQGLIQLEMPNGDAASCVYDVELEPVTPADYGRFFGVHQYALYRFYYDDEGQPHGGPALTFDPTERTRYQGTLDLPAISGWNEWYYGETVFERMTTQTDPLAIAWKLEQTPAPLSIVYTSFGEQ